jgi:hypothetical protein
MQYDVEIPNYKGSVAAPATTPATTTPAATTATTTTTDTETPHDKAIRLAREKAETEYARLYGDLHLAGTGDPWGLHEKFTHDVNEALGAIPGAETNVNLNYSDIFNKAKTGATTSQQNLLTQGVNALTPTGWEDRYAGSTLDDPILQEILNQQSGELTTNLQQQLDRGQISQGAFDYAKNQLGNLSAGAMSTLQNLGGGVLSGYRTTLDDILSNFNKSIANYQLGGNIKPEDFSKQVGSAAGKFDLRGDIMKAFGNTKLFDPNALISKASSVVGPSNQPVAGSTPAGTGTAQDIEDKRTIGTSGVF